MEIAAKLQLKPGQRVAVIGLPSGVDLDLPATPGVAPTSADAVILFVRVSDDLTVNGAALVQAARRDAIAWVAYPKAGGLGTDLNRDALAARLMREGIRPVRQVAIDEVWSALRFRRGG
ncbi:MAG: hypothetical protein WB802_11260 [Candidatus Dormiibacterota bacterium]|jgi:hypothetical protein